jgi:hypothetical protein
MLMMLRIIGSVVRRALKQELLSRNAVQPRIITL